MNSSDEVALSFENTSEEKNKAHIKQRAAKDALNLLTFFALNLLYSLDTLPLLKH